MGRSKTRDRVEPLCRLIRFEATDGVDLAGLLYEPDRRTRRAAVFLHGTGGASIFDSRRTNLLAREFVSRGIAWFPFNNRGAHMIRRPGRGASYEVIRDCVHDIDGAARLLRSRGYRELYLIGHSTGANKIAVYNARKPRNPFKRYVLLAGGDDTGMLYAQLGPRRFRSVLERSRRMIRERRGDELSPIMMLSWRALYDLANPDGDYNVFPFLERMRNIRLGRRAPFRLIRKIRKPALYVYGEHDEFCYDDVPRCTAILAEEVAANAEIVTIGEAGHGFSGFGDELGRLIAEWLEE
ncbi:MAG TPA: alpha/beta hydrolase [Thermoanaerobaculia bacterium]